MVLHSVQQKENNNHFLLQKVERDLSDLKSEKRKLEHAVKSLSMEAKQVSAYPYVVFVYHVSQLLKFVVS